MARRRGVTEPTKREMARRWGFAGEQRIAQPVNQATTKSQSAAAAFCFVAKPLPSVQVRAAVNLMILFKINKRMHHDP